MSQENTRTKTLWSDTQFDMLYSAFQRDRADPVIRPIVRDLMSRGYPAHYLVTKVHDKVGLQAANRLKRIFRAARR